VLLEENGNAAHCYALSEISLNGQQVTATAVEQ
jgi:hypothetical protein